jgi:hypothetical protein
MILWQNQSCKTMVAGEQAKTEGGPAMICPLSINDPESNAEVDLTGAKRRGFETKSAV